MYYVASDSVAQTCLMIVCFDVRSERLSIIRPPLESMVAWKPTSTLINYKGKLAIFNFRCSELYCKIELWIEEDVKKIKWLRKAHSFLRSGNHVWWDSLCKVPISFQGTNQAGEVVISPEFLPLDQIFYILYCDIETGNIRRVEIKGVADDEDFRSRYEIGENGKCHIHISPDYGGNISFI